MEGRSRKMEADNYHKRMVVGAAGMAAALLSLPLTVWDRDTFMMIAMDYGNCRSRGFL